jgi:hypothetical protein
LRKTYAAHEVAIARIGTERVEHGPNLGKNQIMFTSLVALLQPEERLLLVTEFGVDDSE